MRVKRGTTYYLGVSTGVLADAFTFSQFKFQNSQRGVIVRDGQISRWNQVGYFKDHGVIYIFGAYTEGVTLAEVLQYERGEAFPYISCLCRAFEALTAHGHTLPIIHTRGIIFLKDGGVLFLAPECVRVMNDYQSPADRMCFSDPFNHPDLKNNDRISFAISVLCYFAFANVSPWDAEDSDTLHLLMRSGVVLDIQGHNPQIRPQVNQGIVGVLSRPRRTQPSLRYWSNVFGRWFYNGIHRTLDFEEQRHVVRRSRTLFETRKKIYRRRLLLRNNWKRLVGALLIATAVASAPAILHHTSLHRVETHAIESRSVIEQFYLHGFNEGMTALMARSITSDLHFAEIEEIRNLFNRSRRETIFQLQFPLVNPADWLNGRASIGEGQSLYGVEGLTITGLHQGRQRARYKVQYRKWAPKSLYKHFRANAPYESVVWDREDNVSLVKVADSWIIERIERIKNRLADPRRLVHIY